MPASRPLLLCGLLAGGLLLTACGTSETPTSAAADGGTTRAASPITVTDARGKEVTLTSGPAQRIVALEWTDAEMTLTVGAPLVGIADAKGYTTWNAAEKLPQGVADVGTRAEPSVDAIVATNPDLVLMRDSPSTKGLAPQLEKYVPVIVSSGADGKDEMSRMKKDMDLIGTVTGKKEAADAAMADLEAHLEASRTKIADAGKTGSEFMVFDGWVEGSAVNLRMFASGSLMSTLGEKVGLKNAWPGRGDAKWGLQTTDLEGLSPVRDKDAAVFYSASSPEDDIVGSTLSNNPLWKRMEFVKNGHLHKLKPGTWTFGGPKSAKSIVDQYVAVVTG